MDVSTFEACFFSRQGVAVRLFHFSEDPAIEIFIPRQVEVPAKRAPGHEWLNGPLVWAIDDWHQPMYLFPRNCPRILIWRTKRTTPEDCEHYWGQSSSRVIAFIEHRWLANLRSSAICRYEFPPASFECLHDAGMWVSRAAMRPLQKEIITDLPGTLRLHNVELRPMDNLLPLKGLWNTSLHASGIRLRHAEGWDSS
jgi:hypothetical protein